MYIIKALTINLFLTLNLIAAHPVFIPTKELKSQALIGDEITRMDFMNSLIAINSNHFRSFHADTIAFLKNKNAKGEIIVIEVFESEPFTRASSTKYRVVTFTKALPEKAKCVIS